MNLKRLNTSKKYRFFLLMISCTVSTVIFTTTGKVRKAAPKYLQNEFREILNSSENIKTILLWNNFFGDKHFNFGTGKSAFEHAGCAVSNCAIWDQGTGDTDLPHDSFDAVIFHVVDLIRGDLRDKVPRVRHPSQLYAFMLLESPATNSFNLLPYKDLFNITMTYRRDSDVYAPYGWIASKDIPKRDSRGMSPKKLRTDWKEPHFDNMKIPREWTLSIKTKAVVWFVSNCHTPSKREEYVNELSRYIGADIYGDCGSLKCKKKSNVNCYKIVEETYFFYLSFENSLCVDYVTEKFFDILNYNIVPVVYGSAEYDEIAPPRSYINVKDFSSAKELAKYLNYLRKTPEEYKKYFWWKQYYRVIVNTYAVVFCSLCEILNSDSQNDRAPTDIASWWNAPDVCHPPVTI